MGVMKENTGTTTYNESHMCDRNFLCERSDVNTTAEGESTSQTNALKNIIIIESGHNQTAHD